MGNMNAEEAFRNAAYNGVTLRVPKDRDVLLANPKSRVTDELAEGIRANKDELMRRVLWAEASDYVEERYVEGADMKQLAAWQGWVDSQRDPEVPFEEYRRAVRAYVKAALHEFKKARAAS